MDILQIVPKMFVARLFAEMIFFFSFTYDLSHLFSLNRFKTKSLQAIRYSLMRCANFS